MADLRPAHSQSIPEQAGAQPQPSSPDCDLPENSKENLDAKLDHAIEETFPTSDPVSVTITKNVPPEDPREAASRSPRREDRDHAEQDAAEALLDQVKEALQDVAQTASGTMHEAYREGQRYMRQTRDRYPEAERYYQEGRRAVQQQMTDNPWPFLLVAGAIGYGLAWLIHGEHRERDRRVPDYGRSRRGYAYRE